MLLFIQYGLKKISVADVMAEEDCSLRNHGDYTPSLGLHPFVKHSKRKKLKVRHGLTRPFIPLWEYSSEDFALPCTIQELYQVVRKVFSTKAIHTIGRVSNVLISVGDESSGVSHITYSCQHPGQEPCCNIGSLARVIAQELRKWFPVRNGGNASLASTLWSLKRNELPQ